MKATRSEAWAKPCGWGVKVPCPFGGSPRSASTFCTPASANSSRTAASSSREDPTQVTWASGSISDSRLSRFTSATVVARVEPPAP